MVTHFTVWIAVAKQMPCAIGMIAVLRPITSPRELTSAPPEFAGLRRGVRLQHIVNQPAARRAQAAAERAHHACGDRVLEP